MSKKYSDNGFLHKAYDRNKQPDTKALYRDWAATYDAEVSAENDYAQPHRCATALAEVLNERSGNILDIGCGTGLSGVALKHAGFPNIDGCDFSAEMLDLAAEKNIYRHLFSADLNATPIDAPTGHYHAATAVGVFSFDLINPDSLDEIFRLLKPGAPLVIGLNERFYVKGTLENKFSELEDNGKAVVLSRELGDHLPGIGVKGWVIVLRKAG